MRTKTYFLISIFGYFALTGSAQAQTGFSDNFESDAVGSFPANWLQSGNTVGIVDNSISHSGGNSLKLFGQPGGCWSDLALRQMEVAPPWQLVCYINNGPEGGTGCHPAHGSLQLHTGPDWTYPLRNLLNFETASGQTNELQTGNLNGWTTVGTFNTNQWYKIKILYQLIGTNEVRLYYCLNDTFLTTVFDTAASYETNLTYITLQSGEGATWFDDVTVAPAPALSITPVGGNIILSWPTNAGTFTLQTTTSLVLPVAWSTVSAAPSIVNGQETVTNQISTQQQFFRLSL